MDLLMGMVSLVKDMNSVDKEYRNLNLQLKYTLNKASRILQKMDLKQDKIALVILKTRMQEGEVLSKKLDDLLNTQSIAIKDKIRLSLPFNQTRSEIVNVVETLERVVNDLKEQISDTAATQNKMENRQGGIKRKVSDTIDQSTVLKISTKNQLTVQEIDQHIEQVYEMGPTLREDEYTYSEHKHKDREIQFIITVHGSEQIMSLLAAEDLATTSVKINQKNVPKQQILYTAARIKFQKCYNKIKAITKDIDRMSTKAHFHFVFQSDGTVPMATPNQLSRNSLVVNKKGSKQRVSASQKLQDQVFFSFPQDDRNNQNFQFKILVRKQDQNKSLYRHINDEWTKVQQNQIQILNDDKLAAFVSPGTKEPSLYFQINYNLIAN